MDNTIQFRINKKVRSTAQKELLSKSKAPLSKQPVSKQPLSKQPLSKKPLSKKPVNYRNMFNNIKYTKSSCGSCRGTF
jgi:hypothetical protein